MVQVQVRGTVILTREVDSGGHFCEDPKAGHRLCRMRRAATDLDVALEQVDAGVPGLRVYGVRGRRQ